jgi:hypothetical protein
MSTSFKVVDGWDDKANGSSYQGAIDISYNEIVAKLGKPTGNDGHKVDAEWLVEFNDGTVATIYNYKDGKNYNGKIGLETSEIRDWHIGGHNKEVVDKVHKIFSE